MIVYITFNGNAGANNYEMDASFQDLVSEIHALDGIRMEEPGGQKSLVGTKIIAAEMIKTGAVTKIAEVIGGWLLKDKSRSLKLKIGLNEIEASGLTEQEQQKLIKWFMDQACLPRDRRK